MQSRIQTRVKAAPPTARHAASVRVVARCFVNGHACETVEKAYAPEVTDCLREEEVKVLTRPPVSVQELTYEIGVSRQVAFRLQQQYWRQSVEEVKEGCFELQKVLQINIEEAALLASKEPRLMASPRATQKTFEVLRTALGNVTPMEASRIAVHTPSLLTIPADELEAKFQVLLERLDVPREDLCSLVAKQPNVLTTPVERVEKRIADLSSLLAPLTASQTVCLLYSFPALMAEDMKRLTLKMEALQDMLQADSSEVVSMVLRYPPVLITTVEVTESRLQTTADLLCVGQSSVNNLALNCPNIFTIPANILRDHFEKVFCLFGHMDRDGVVDLISKNPALLGLDL